MKQFFKNLLSKGVARFIKVRGVKKNSELRYAQFLCAASALAIHPKKNLKIGSLGLNLLVIIILTKSLLKMLCFNN